MNSEVSKQSLEEQSISRDAFIGGRVNVSQPRHGFRAGLDSVLLAASVNEAATNVLELGAGAGVVSCCVLAQLPNSVATLVELQPEMAQLAQQNLNDNSIADRAQVLSLDVTAKGAVRKAAGLAPDCFSSVIANPPFFDVASGSHPPDPGRARARHMLTDELDLWVKTAATSAAPRGEIIFIHAAAALPRIVAAFSARFGDIQILPIHPRADQPANRVLVRGIKGSRAPLSLLPGYILHGDAGREFLPAPNRIFRGEGRLDW